MSNNPPLNFHPDGTLFIVSGPSGAGKTTLINAVRQELLPLGISLYFSISHTTREPRAGEREGVNYFYVSKLQFERMVAAGEFIEWAHVHDEMYGTSRAEVRTRLDAGEDVILDIDVQGARQIAESEQLQPHSLSVFVFPPSINALQSRLESRGLNSRSEIDLRMKKAFDEIEQGLSFYDYIIINDKLELAKEWLKASIIARKLKSKSALVELQKMAQRFKEERSGTIA